LLLGKKWLHHGARSRNAAVRNCSVTVARAVLFVHHANAVMMLMRGFGRRSSARPRAEDADQSEHCKCEPNPTGHLDRVSLPADQQDQRRTFLSYPHTPDLARATATSNKLSRQAPRTSNGSIRCGACVNLAKSNPENPTVDQRQGMDRAAMISR